MPDYISDYKILETGYRKLIETRILAAITFFVKPTRMSYLHQVLDALLSIPARSVHVLVFVNKPMQDEDDAALENLYSKTRGRSVEIQTVSGLDHPYNLTWAHKSAIPERFLPDPNYTLFVYLEDDEVIEPKGLAYFLAARELLRATQLIPGFLRVEHDPSELKIFNIDHVSKVNLYCRPYIEHEGLVFVNADSPYNGSYILDRELAVEHVLSPSFDRVRSEKVCSWGVRERAAMGLTFEWPPSPFKYRLAVPVSAIKRQTPRFSWIWHLPANYATDPNSPFGKIPVEELFVHTDSS